VRVVVLGADGMAGHAIVRQFARGHEVFGTTRAESEDLTKGLGISPAALISGIDVRDTPGVVRTITELDADAIINCAGIVKQRPSEAVELLEVNALFPHRLAAALGERGPRLVHLSTDCVFSGRRGFYSENDLPDPADLYGVSKLAGELSQPGAVTIRTSIVGLEIKRRTSLVEWLLAQRGSVRGFRQAIFSGLTTVELARVAESILEKHGDLHGVWHVASAPISKFDLLSMLAERTHHSVDVVPDDDFVCDRSLDGSAFQKATGYVPPAWEDMIAGLAREIEARRAA
jgi:dTDP-4-dehydrorhamnose reductase